MQQGFEQAARVEARGALGLGCAFDDDDELAAHAFRVGLGPRSEFAGGSGANRLKFSLRALNKSAVMLERLRQEALPDQEPKNTLFLVTADRAVSDVCWGEPPAPHGIVVDIGTTTVVAAIVNLTTGIAVRTVSLLKSQRRFGADVISRIQSATKGHAQELQASIRANILQGIDELDVHYPETICVMAIAGNTTMLHLLLGLPCRPMAELEKLFLNIS